MGLGTSMAHSGSGLMMTRSAPPAAVRSVRSYTGGPVQQPPVPARSRRVRRRPARLGRA